MSETSLLDIAGNEWEVVPFQRHFTSVFHNASRSKGKRNGLRRISGEFYVSCFQKAGKGSQKWGAIPLL